jgi:uncharacterized protein YybS (DUF2232 family)
LALNGAVRGVQDKFFVGILITTAVISIPSFAGKFGWLQSFVPLPVFYYLTILGEQQGRKLIAIATLVAAIIAAITGTIQILFYSCMLIPLGFFLANSARKKESLNITAFKGVLYLAVIWLLYGFVHASITQSNPYNDTLAELDKDIVATFETIEQQYKDLPFDTKRELKAAFERLRLLIPKILPALLAIIVLSTVWLNLVIGQQLLKKTDKRLSLWGNIREWCLPDGLIWGAILAGIFSALPFAPLNTVGVNLLLVFGTCYFFQGMSVFATLLAKWSTPPGIRVFIYLLLLLIQVYAITLIMILGVADIWMDLRKVEKKERVN